MVGKLGGGAEVASTDVLFVDEEPSEWLGELGEDDLDVEVVKEVPGVVVELLPDIITKT